MMPPRPLFKNGDEKVGKRKRFELTDFERVLLQAAEEDDTLSMREKRWIRFAVYFGGQRLTRRIEQAVVQMAVDEGEIGDGDDKIDWDALLEFIRKLLEIILAFIIGLPT